MGIKVGAMLHGGALTVLNDVVSVGLAGGGKVDGSFGFVGVDLEKISWVGGALIGAGSGIGGI